MTDDSSTDETTAVQHNVTESADKVVLTTKIKRGTGTRDQDSIKVKVKADDPERAAEKLHETVVAVGDRGTVNALRATRASEGSDD
jgi:hypothetical protein